MIKRILQFFCLWILFVQPVYALTLQEAIRETVDQSPDVLISDKDRKAIEQALEQALRTISLDDIRAWFTHCGYPVHSLGN